MIPWPLNRLQACFVKMSGCMLIISQLDVIKVFWPS